VGETGGPVRVLISYAHGDSDHEESVRKLWWLLRSSGVDARLDVTAAGQRQFWPDWMGEQLREAAFVLVVASPEYRERGEDRGDRSTGRGVRWEARLLKERWYADPEAGLRSILPVVLPGGDTEGLPDWLLPVGGTVYQVAELSERGMEELLRVLTVQPREIEPPIGPVRTLPPRSSPFEADPGGSAAARDVRRHLGPGQSRLVIVGAVAAVLLVMGSLAAGNGWLRTLARADSATQVPSPSSRSAVSTDASLPPPHSSAPSPSQGASSLTTNSSRPSSKAATRTSKGNRPSTASVTLSPTTDSSESCRAASTPGGIDIGPELNNAGGPNFVPTSCTSLWLTLTEVHYVTYARACLEDMNGSTVRCGSWILLEDGGAWNLLLGGVSPGDRWRLELKADGPGHVSFDFSNK
jgi:hypothetical protein